MDLLDPAKKRAQRRRLFLGYILVAIAIGIASLILVYLSYGYTIDRKTGQVIQNGTTFVAATPESADIYINGIRRTKTDARFSLAAGQYDVELKRDGYRNWSHPLNLEGGKVERLDYPKLFPIDLITSDVQLYSSLPAVASQSPDHRWLLVLQPGTLGSFDSFDLNDPAKAPVALGVPADLLTSASGSQQISIVEWASDNRHVLLLHTYQGGQEYILLDRESPAQSINLDKTLGTSGVQISLKEKKQDQFYLFNPVQEKLATEDLKTRVAAPLLDHVLAFKDREGGVILYVSDADVAAGKVRIKLHDGDNDYTIREQAAGAHNPIEIARYSGRWYVVVGSESEGKSYIYRDPASALKQEPAKILIPISVLKVADVSGLSFSSSTQYIMANAGSSFSVYDIENDRRYQYDIRLPIEGGSLPAWMDSSRLMLLSGGRVAAFDYDGTNLQLLSPSATLPFFDHDYLNMYGLASSVTVPGRSALVQTNLKIKK